ncbi:MAG: sigma-70 family RNA polymerase sigma factor [Sedimentisphaerales bacterium]|nr:sigma-70 family RNA polymerase sigma factor [Sedimentisphaerales bacterium]
MQEDKWLVEQLKRGDSAALSQIYEKYGESLLLIAHRLLKDRASAEDVLHDVFLAFAEAIESFTLTGGLRSFLATCTVNRARDVYRRRKRIWPLEETDAIIGDPGNQPEQEAQTNEELELLAEAMGGLPYEQREAILLKIHGGLKFREIGEIQNVSTNTVQGRYRYGMEKLRQFLDDEADHEEHAGYRTVG